MKKNVLNIIHSLLHPNQFYFLDRKAIEINDYHELKRIFNWKQNPVMDRDDLDKYEFVEDVNNRRRRDAEALATVIRNIKPKVTLEIGTSDGGGTVLMAANAGKGKVYTINIPPEDIEKGFGGTLITVKLTKDQIGIKYRQRGLKNINQIYADSAAWKPDIGVIDVAYIDGCHDTEYVYNDTVKVIRNMKAGSFILWHDFNPHFTRMHHWVNDVCNAIDKLYRNGILKGNLYYIRDSWVGIYKV